MSIREEFEKAFEAEFGPRAHKEAFCDGGDDIARGQTALWAAKWMAERCANVADFKVKVRYGNDPEFEVWQAAPTIAENIRQLAQELSR